MTSRIILNRGRARPFFGRHPWVFSGSIQLIEGSPKDGEEVSVFSHDGQFIAHGLYNSQSQIAVRLYSWEYDEALDERFWRKQLEAAIHLRKKTLTLSKPQYASRLVFSEGDHLSGLIVDEYDHWLVLQINSLAIAKRESIFVRLLSELLNPKGMMLRTDSQIAKMEGLHLKEGLICGEERVGLVEIIENDLKILVDIQGGQKTGYYMDQRDNRAHVRNYAAGRKALDVCCYTGGFTLNLAKAGASDVTGVDISSAFLKEAVINAERNGFNSIHFEAGDAFEVLKYYSETGNHFGMIVLDPPKFSRSRGTQNSALEGYARLNEAAVRVLEPDGILVTCSCSGRVTRSDFIEMLGNVSERTRRPIQILEQRGAALDHPVSASCPETDYLKCFICRVAPTFSRSC